MTHCVNGFIDNNQGMPEYGQLGCQGFIILDAKHRVVSSATSAFMQVRELAFKHVEALLSAVCSGRPLPAVCPGEYVKLMEAPADKPKLAGQTALCIGAKEDQLVVVFLQGSYRGKQIQVNVSSVQKVNEESDDEESRAGGGGCGPNGSSCGTGGCGPNGSSQGNCNENKSSCGPGGCSMPSKSDDCSKKRRVDESIVNNALQLVSVKVPSMDHEHDECAAALRELASSQSPSALEAAIRCLLEHFEHEEALFEEFGFGGNAEERFSAKKTHIEDHRRITNRMQKQLQESTSSVCAEFIEEVLKDFHEHTTRYDVQYSELLSSKGAK